jgi:Phosphoenolpyruvate carboxykinase C-terminal P-loop domain
VAARHVSRSEALVGDDRGGDRQGRRDAPRLDGDAAVLRLQHGRLLGPLARHGEADEESAEDLPRELVPDNGKFLWPGFGENLRVLKWALDRCQGRGKAEETDIGYVPAIDAIDRTGLEISDDAMRQLLRVDRADWIEVVQGQRKYFEKFGDHLPAGIGKEHEALARRVAA